MLVVRTVTVQDMVAATRASRGPASLRRALVGFRAPDVLVVELPDDDAAPATALVAEAVPDTRLLVICPGEDGEIGLACLRAGADGVLARHEAADGLLGMLARLRQPAEDLVRTPAVATTAVDASERWDPCVAIGTRPGAPLTRTQQRVLELMTTGATNRAIATRLGRSETAVKNAATAIYAALGAANRAEAVAKWSRLSDVPA